MVIWTGKEAEDKVEKLQWAEAVDGYYDYTDAKPNNQGSMSAVIRKTDKQCLFLNAKRHYGYIVADGTPDEFEEVLRALRGVERQDVEEMIKCARELPSL